MAAPAEGGGYSVTPTQRVAFNIRHASRKSDDFSTLQRPSAKDSRSLSGGASHLAPKSLVQSAAGTGPPGSFSTELKSTTQSRSTTPQNEYGSYQMPRLLPRDSDGTTSEQRLVFMRERIAKEKKIKLGTENMLEALMSKNAKQTKEQRQRIEQELGSSNRKLAELELELDQEIQRSQTIPSTPPTKRVSAYFKGSPLKSEPRAQTSDNESPEHSDGESPTVVLTDTLQALEVEGMQPDYYIDRANPGRVVQEEPDVEVRSCLVGL
jgi:rapamycin-insensitive companion of mTOR